MPADKDVFGGRPTDINIHLVREGDAEPLVSRGGARQPAAGGGAAAAGGGDDWSISSVGSGGAAGLGKPMGLQKVLNGIGTGMTGFFNMAKKFFPAMLGIGTIQGVLGKSSLFGATIGLIFDLLGVLVDMILMPFLLPLLVALGPIIGPLATGIGKLVTWLQKNKALGGALGGAAIGFMLGGPAGALIGGVAGGALGLMASKNLGARIAGGAAMGGLIGGTLLPGVGILPGMIIGGGLAAITSKNLASKALGGAAAGAMAGALIGSVVPGVGTVVGAGVGAFAGAIGGLMTSSKVRHWVNPKNWFAKGLPYATTTISGVLHAGEGVLTAEENRIYAARRTSAPKGRFDNVFDIVIDSDGQAEQLGQMIAARFDMKLGTSLRRS